MYKMNRHKMNGPKYIKVTDLDITDGKLEIKLHYSKNIKKYFLTDYFFVEYEQNMSNVDKSILYIPIVSTIITAAWAVGADIYIEELDKTYLNSLSKIKHVFKKRYPQFSFSTNLYVKHIISNQFNGGGYGLLFSGGVDSLTSFIRHKNTHPDLFTVWGADIPIHENDFWERVRNQISLFSNQEGVKVHFIRTNMQQLLNQHLLAREYKLEGWWGPVSHGLMLLGLVAPLTTKGIGTIIIASPGRGDDNDATNLLSDSNVSWADVRVAVDGYELSRHEKIKDIIKHPEYLPHLRVCYSSFSNYNCGRCEKCLRTITALILEGVNPKNCNFNIDEKIFRYIKDCLVKGKLIIERTVIELMWMDTQKHIPKHIPEQFNNDMLAGSKEFFTWFKEFDLSKYRTNKLRHTLWTISYIVAEKQVMKTIKKAPAFIMRKLRFG